MINKIIAEEKIQQVRKLLEKKEKIVITCHVSPDGDAIGASLGLYHFLDGLGKCGRPGFTPSESSVFKRDERNRSLYSLSRVCRKIDVGG